MSTVSELVAKIFKKELCNTSLDEKIADAYSLVYTNIFIDNIQKFTLHCSNYKFYKEQQDRNPNYDMSDYCDFSFYVHDGLMSKFPDIPNTNDINIFSILMELSEMKEVQDYVNKLPPIPRHPNVWVC